MVGAAWSLVQLTPYHVVNPWPAVLDGVERLWQERNAHLDSSQSASRQLPASPSTSLEIPS